MRIVRLCLLALFVFSAVVFAGEDERDLAWELGERAFQACRAVIYQKKRLKMCEVIRDAVETALDTTALQLLDTMNKTDSAAVRAMDKEPYRSKGQQIFRNVAQWVDNFPKTVKNRREAKQSEVMQHFQEEALQWMLDLATADDRPQPQFPEGFIFDEYGGGTYVPPPPEDPPEEEDDDNDEL